MTSYARAAIACCLLAWTALPPAFGAEDPGPVLTYENYWHQYDFRRREPSLGHFFSYVGTHNYEAVLDDPVVKPNLELVFGPHLPRFLRAIRENRFNIEFTEWGIVLRGHGMPRYLERVARDHAILFVDLYGNRVYGGIFSDGVTTIFSDEKEFAELPLPIQFWAQDSKVERLVGEEPKTNFRLVTKRFR